MTTARHYAEKVRATLNSIRDAEDRKTEALCVTRDSDAYEKIRGELHGLRATLELHAAGLVDAVLAETTPVAPTLCGAEFAGHVCDLHEGHFTPHHDSRTELRWD